MNTTKIFLIAKVGKKKAGGWNSRVSGQTTRISFKTGNSQKEDLYNGKAAQSLWISIPIPRYPIPFPVFFLNPVVKYCMSGQGEKGFTSCQTLSMMAWQKNWDKKYH